MRNEHHGALRAGDLAIVLSGLASFTDKILTFSHFLFEAETGTLVACAEAVGVKFDQKIRKIMRFTDEDRARLERRKLQFA
jgi:acyl-CoA thioester hydrolase